MDQAYKAIVEGDYDLLERLIYERKIDLNSTSTYGLSLLHYACTYNQTRCTHLLLRNNANLNAFGRVNGQTPLHEAAKCGNVEVFELNFQSGDNLTDNQNAYRTRRATCGRQKWQNSITLRCHTLPSRGLRSAV
jgi:ankyrin repeat protein